jgi:hypothetical protein
MILIINLDIVVVKYRNSHLAGKHANYLHDKKVTINVHSQGNRAFPEAKQTHE